MFVLYYLVQANWQGLTLVRYTFKLISYSGVVRKKWSYACKYTSHHPTLGSRASPQYIYSNDTIRLNFTALNIL